MNDMANKKRIYLDYAATTPVCPEALKAMLPYLKQNFGNPSSIHSFGQETRGAVEKAREKIAKFLNCLCSEIIFTGSATEANNLAIFGVVQKSRQKIKNPHIITSTIEHHAILEPCRQLKKQGVEITLLPVDKDGLLNPSQVKKAIKESTVLVSVMYTNNEIGTIQPIAEIGKLVRNLRTPESRFPFFHTDAVQAVNYLDCDVQKLGVDLLTLSGHKIYGPKGVGALYIREDSPLAPIIYGGGQENGRRSGTENTAAIVGLGAAIDEVKNQKLIVKSLEKLRNKLLNGILEKIPEARLNGSREHRLPNNINVSIPGAEGEAMVIALDQESIAASTGSACSSGSLEPSHVLLALGLSQKEAHCSLRLTLGRYTTDEEVKQTSETLTEVVQRLRKIAGYKAFGRKIPSY